MSMSMSNPMPNSIVLYPSPGIGHLIAMVELGKLILTHTPSFSIIVLITPTPFETDTTARINRVSSTTPSITFHHFPTVTPPPISSSFTYIDLLCELPHLQNLNLLTTLQSISRTSSLKALILDFFCSPAIEVSTTLDIPTYFFFTSCASGLALFLHLPTVHENTSKSFKDMDDFIHCPGLPPIHSQDMPEAVFDRDTNCYKNFLSTAFNLRNCAGILTNTFDALEPRAIQTIWDGACVPDDPTPPFYGIGPLVASNYRSEHECLSWLASQPSQSVVFLCFGSLGLFSHEQLNAMAIGLENSGHRFLWVVRNPPPEDKTKRAPPPEPDLDALLPEGFLERTKGKGLVVKSWAPQVDVLSHDSVGGFVTHCGWNSALEAVLAGVPMLAWPLYAEQRINRVFLVEEMKVALPMKESKKDRFVSSDELGKRVIELMEGERGKVVREKVIEMRDAAMVAVGEGGSSKVALAKFVQSLKPV